jgi:hypothetical protein
VVFDSTTDSLTVLKVNGTAGYAGQFENLASEQILRRVKSKHKGMEYT